MQTERLENGQYYHIYNRGIDSCDLFRDEANYKFTNADRSVDAVRFDQHKWETTDLSACAAPDSVKIHSHIFIRIGRESDNVLF